MKLHELPARLLPEPAPRRRFLPGPPKLDSIVVNPDDLPGPLDLRALHRELEQYFEAHQRPARQRALVNQALTRALNTPIPYHLTERFSCSSQGAS